MSHKYIKFLKEKYEKENKSLKFQEKFIALPRLKLLSSKFYAKHDILSTNDAPVQFIKLIKRSVSSIPKDRFKFPPPTINMEYGWFANASTFRSTNKRFRFPLKQCDYIKNEIYIRAMEQKLPQNKFAGTPFRF